MGLKHAVKLLLRSLWARLLFHSGLHALVDALMPRRLTILGGHCVAAESNAVLPVEMRIGAEQLERILTWFARRYELVSVAQGLERLEAGGKRSLVALSMDDGYRDNRRQLLPLLQRLEAGATVYLETRALSERVPNWSHTLAWVLERTGGEGFIGRFTALSTDAHSNGLLGRLAVRGQASPYAIKRLLKYEVPVSERARALDALFAELGGDARALCAGLYMDWDDARALAQAGVDVGGHTVSHEILARLDAPAQRREIEGCRAAIERELGCAPVSFAYPFGRRWDYGPGTPALVLAAGFASAVTTHPGVNLPGGDRGRLKRVMIDGHARLHLLVAEACGGFELLRRIGIDLSE